MWLHAVVLALSLARAGVINDQLQSYQLRFANDGAWSVKKNVEAVVGNKKIRTLEIQSGDTTIEMSILVALTTYQADQESKTEYASILSAYKAAVTPYAGAVSRTLSCAKEFFPKDMRTEFAGQKARALIGYATERRTFGVCNMDEAKSEFAFVSANLPGNTLIKLTGFRKRTGALDAKYWKKLLAEFKFNGGTNGTKSKPPKS